MRVKLPFVIIAILIFVYLFGNSVDTSVVTFFYTISYVIKEALVLVLPIVIFIFMTAFLVEFNSGVILFIAGLIGCIIVSNTLVTFYSYGIFSLLHPLVVETTHHTANLTATTIIKPTFGLPIKKIVDNNIALLAGLVMGIVLAFLQNQGLINGFKKARETSVRILRKTLTPIIPLFIFGFMLKLQKEDLLEHMIVVYSKVFIVILITMILYITAMYTLLAKGNIVKAFKTMQAFFPAAITAFSTMSSMAAYPLTLECAKKTSNNIRLTQGILTSTVNIHLMGVGIAIPIMAMTVVMYFGQPFPSLWSYSVFAFFLIMAKFTVAAIPGGSVVIAIPILQDHLGFTPEMSALMMSLYVLVDPFSTTTNV
ncbi:MAG: cation:dicarboxylase symporter family transporter, partial [Alphaproteobacteria bacterium]|nr:cation:dicarboxylase symporter family transporter [Alphaproteobacteria bacterium]